MSIKCKLDMERQHGAPGRELRVAQEETHNRPLMLAVLVVSCADNCGAASGEPREAVEHCDGWADNEGQAQAGDEHVFHRTDCYPQAVFVGPVEVWGPHSAISVNRVGVVMMVLMLSLKQIMEAVLARLLVPVGQVRFPPVWMEILKVTLLNILLVQPGALVLVLKDMLSEW